MIAAFARVENGRRVRNMLERSGTASCLVCTSAVHAQQASAVVLERL